MPARIPDEERERIIAALDTGKSANQIAKEFGRSNSTISRIAREVGHVFAQSNAVHAREIRAVYNSERRAGLIGKSIESAERIFGQMFAETLAYNFGGKDNTYEEHIIPEPDARAKRDLSAAISTLIKTAAELEKLEQVSGADDMLLEFTAAIQARRAERDPEDDNADL